MTSFWIRSKRPSAFDMLKLRESLQCLLSSGPVCWVPMCDTESAVRCWLLRITDGDIQCELVRLVSPAQQPKSLPRSSLSLWMCTCPLRKRLALSHTIAQNADFTRSPNAKPSLLLCLPGSYYIHYPDSIYSHCRLSMQLTCAPKQMFAKSSTGLL